MSTAIKKGPQVFTPALHYSCVQQCNTLHITVLDCISNTARCNTQMNSTNSANLSIVMRQNHLYLEINEATLIRGPSAALCGQRHQYCHCFTPPFSRCSRPNRQNVTLCCPSPQSYWPDKGPGDSCSPALPATLCCLHLNTMLQLLLMLYICLNGAGGHHTV